MPGPHSQRRTHNRLGLARLPLMVGCCVLACLARAQPPKSQSPSRHQAAGNFLHNGVTAHRGDSVHFPENTMPALLAGIEAGADWIELDIFRTSDNQLVVIHDASTKRTGDRELLVATATYEQLQAIDVAIGFRRQHQQTLAQCPPAQIPLLKDVLRNVMQQHRTRVSIQPKMDCVADAIALVKQLGAERWVGFNDGNLKYMQQVKSLAPEIPVFWDRGPHTNIDEDLTVAQRHGFEALVIHHSGITEEKVAKVRQARLEIGAWTVNQPARMIELLDLGVQRIYTDDPRALLSVRAASR